jgi:hypothetical protein
MEQGIHKLTTESVVLILKIGLSLREISLGKQNIQVEISEDLIFIKIRGISINFEIDFIGPWRSPVARHLGVVEVAGSNPVGPTNFLTENPILCPPAPSSNKNFLIIFSLTLFLSSLRVPSQGALCMLPLRACKSL